MERFDDKYVNIHTDFGFKRIFGTEFNKELLISFLNALLDGEQVIRDVHYLNNEHLGESIGFRKAIFDVFCENEHGEKFIVEMQNVYQKFFKDRSIYYATFPIREQAHPGDWDFHLKSVYTVGLLNFVLDDDRYSTDCFHHEVKLMDVEKKTVFYDKLTFIYVEIPKFNKTEQELVSMFDKWMYVLKNLSRLMRRPAALQERVFTRLFEQAEIAKLSHHELQQYENDMKAYRDIVNAIRTASHDSREKGLAEGIEKGRIIGKEEGRIIGKEEGLIEGQKEAKKEIARKLKAMGAPTGQIVAITGLSADEVNAL